MFVHLCLCIRHGPDCTVARDVKHWLLLLLYHVHFLPLHVKPNFGSVLLAHVLLPTVYSFSNIAPLLNTHLLSTYKTWNTCNFIILYHTLCLSVNCNLAYYWSLCEEVRLSYWYIIVAVETITKSHWVLIELMYQTVGHWRSYQPPASSTVSTTQTP